MKVLLLSIGLLFGGQTLQAQPTDLPAYKPENIALYKTVVALDSTFFMPTIPAVWPPWPICLMKTLNFTTTVAASLLLKRFAASVAKQHLQQSDPNPHPRHY
ncbi:hypothetical protein [Phnomibacter ginsenosidimutans]|uniref:hypothetical protein n=1 Tax=Phnomibacter ginsenosidimutans TaxID=2676868 RepID=UPI0018D25D8E|nr:hypothetical protein [Phnomibacter ginsenosidimutans]